MTVLHALLDTIAQLTLPKLSVAHTDLIAQEETHSIGLALQDTYAMKKLLTQSLAQLDIIAHFTIMSKLNLLLNVIQVQIVLVLISIKLLARLDLTLTLHSLYAAYALLEHIQMVKKHPHAKLVKQGIFVLEELLEKIRERLRKEGTHALRATIVGPVQLLQILAQSHITTHTPQKLQYLIV